MLCLMQHAGCTEQCNMLVLVWAETGDFRDNNTHGTMSSTVSSMEHTASQLSFPTSAATARTRTRDRKGICAFFNSFFFVQNQN